jgi:hypothetical protein
MREGKEDIEVSCHDGQHRINNGSMVVDMRSMRGREREGGGQLLTSYARVEEGSGPPEASEWKKRPYRTPNKTVALW